LQTACSVDVYTLVVVDSVYYLKCLTALKFCRNIIANSSARFFRFPTDSHPDRLKLWSLRCKRKAPDGSSWEPKADVKYIYVCSEHFVSG